MRRELATTVRLKGVRRPPFSRAKGVTGHTPIDGIVYRHTSSILVTVAASGRKRSLIA